MDTTTIGTLYAGGVPMLRQFRQFAIGLSHLLVIGCASFAIVAADAGFQVYLIGLAGLTFYFWNFPDKLR